MTELVQSSIVLALAFLVSMLTLLTGFGLGTVLTPIVALWYDAKSAVILVSIVHISNNLLKFSLFRRSVDLRIFLRFGLVSLAGAAVGGFLFTAFNEALVRVLLGAVLIGLGSMEFFPATFRRRIPPRLDTIGGFLSGLMGGLLGNQGAIRSAYLLNYNLSKEAFIATATAISLVIDLTRIPLYVWREADLLSSAWPSFLPIVFAAFAGTMVGTQMLKNISLERFRFVVARCVILMGIIILIRSLT